MSMNGFVLRDQSLHQRRHGKMVIYLHECGFPAKVRSSRIAEISLVDNMISLSERVQTMGGKLWPIKLLLASLLFCAGCGGDAGPAIYSVTGKLTKGDKPLAGVIVTFSPVEGGPSSSGQTNESGAFILLSASGKAGAVAGKHKVTLAVPVVSSAGSSTGPIDYAKMAAEREAMTKGGNAGAPVADVKKDDKVPAEYSDPAKTPLPAYEVKAGSNDFDIKIP